MKSSRIDVFKPLIIRRLAMNRREFIKQMGLPLVMAWGALFAVGNRQPIQAGSKKGSNKRNRGKKSGNASSGAPGGSNLTGMDLGSGRLKAGGGKGNDKGFIVFDDLSK
jgi:hypothetical protein